MSLGSIIVKLQMNTADFETDAGRAAKVAEKRAKEIDAAFRKAGTAIGLVLGAAMVGAAYAIKKTIDNMDELSKSAQRVGLPTEDFSRLAYAGSLADVEMSTLVSTLGKLTKAQAASLNATSEQAKVFKALGIDAIDPLTGKMRSSMDVLKDFADRFQQMKGSPEIMAAGFSLFGRSFQDMIPLIKDGSKGLSDMADESDRLGNTLSTEAGIAAEKFNDDLTRLQTIIGGVWKEIAVGLLPVLDSSVTKLRNMAEEGDLAANAVTLISTALKAGVWLLNDYNSAVKLLSISMGTFSELAAGALEINKQIFTLGAADGTIMGGFARQRAALANDKKQFNQLIADEELRSAGMTRDQYNKQMAGMFQIALPGAKIPGISSSLIPDKKFNFAEDQTKKLGKTVDKAEDYAARINAALAGNTPKGGAKKSSGKSDAQKLADDAARAAKQAEDAQRRWNSSILDMEARLAGPVAEALREFQRSTQQLEADFHNGEVTLADYTKALGLYADQRDKEIKAINDRKSPAQQMLADMQFELELLGKTRDEQELLTAARWLGAEAATAEGQAALAAMKTTQEAAKVTAEQIELMDGVRDAAMGFFNDLKNGVGIFDALKNAAASFAEVLFQMAAQKLIAQIFGDQGSTQGGSAGGGWGGFLMNLFGAFAGGGKGYASGGYTGAGGVNEIAGMAHKGEVVWSQGDVARAGGVPTVEGMRKGGGGGKRQRIVLVENQRDAEAMMRGSRGEDAVMIHIQNNPNRIREMLNG